MKRVRSFLAVLLLAAGIGTISGALLACAPTPVTGATKLDVSLGTPPAAGWIWLVGVINIGPEKAEEKLTAHTFAWAFFVVKGSTEISTAEGKRTLSAGEGVVIPAGQQHSHSYLPESEILVIQARPADQPTKQKTPDVHGGKAVFPLGERINVTGGVNYRLRVREFSLSRGQRIADAFDVGPNFGYVKEGTLTFRKGDGLSTVEAGKTFSLPLEAGHITSNESATPGRFILVDVH